MTLDDKSKESKQIVVELTMSVADARNVIWQGRGPHEPMGKLLDAKQIDSGDLAWAVDKAYSPQMRSAARTLLADWLGQAATVETTKQYGPTVIEGSHYLEDSLYKSLMWLGILVGISSYGVALVVREVVSQLSGTIIPRWW